MAAPTNFRAEAIGQTQTVLRWSYSGSAAIGIYRSTDGISYSLITTVSAATHIYNDTGLVSGTKYWYKLSDDVGLTFSTVKTVVTHSCGDESIKHKGFSLPRFNPIVKNIGHRGGQQELDEKEVPVLHQKLGKAMRDIEDVVKKNVFFQEPCEVCIVNGAIVVDCADGCDCYNVEANTDINSISFVNCEGIDPCIRFRVPPNTTVGICGFPQGHQSSTQFSGDECFQAPISGGAEGRTVGTGKAGGGKSKPGSGESGGSGPSGVGTDTSDCECLPSAAGGLTVECCSTDCSMDCQSAKALDILICGGTGPYNISGSAGLVFKTSNGATVGTTTPIQESQRITITPPTNSGSATAGVAYIKKYWQCSSCGGSPNCGAVDSFGHQDFKCDDTQSGGCFTPADGHSHCTPSTPLASAMTCAEAGQTCLPTCASFCAGVVTTCDDRTAPMIAAGCNPCGISTASKTFTVTDAQGTSVVTVLQV